MRKTIFIALFSVSMQSGAQTVFGDFNGDNEITVDDVTHLVNTALGKEEKITTPYDPYHIDNTRLVGEWQETPTSYYVFNEDGTCSYATQTKIETYRYYFYCNIGKVLYENVSTNNRFAYDIFFLPNGDFLSGQYSLNKYTKGKPTLYVTSVELNKSNIEMVVGGTYEMVATITPVNATDNTFSWTSTDETVATCDDGVITALSEGTTTITVSTTDGSNLSASCSVKVFGNTYYICKDVAYPLPEVVDLGLPSGTKWANRYLCQNSQQTVVKSFPFGSLNPTLRGYDAEGIWQKYKDGHSLEACDDAAQCYLGGGWHTPTYEQVQELIEYCDLCLSEGDYIIVSKINGCFIPFMYNSWTSKFSYCLKSPLLEDENGYIPIEIGSCDYTSLYPILPVWNE